MRQGDKVGRFVVERVLGEGGMATVYLARHEILDSLHALKVLRVDADVIKQRLLTEGKVQASLRHPNVVAVTDVVETETGVALVMEYVNGPALDEYLASSPLGVAESLRIFNQLCMGLAAAHERGMVHRDLKPENILLHRSNTGLLAKVTDFGIVKVYARSGKTKSGVIMGTPEYMSPEQVRDSGSVDARSDLWALGVMLYEMISGKVPFEAPDTLTTYNLIAAGDYVPISERVPAIPPWVEAVIDDLLTVDPNDRIPSIGVLLERINPSITAEAVTTSARMRKKRSRRGLTLVAIAGAGLALCAGGGGGVMWWLQPPPPVSVVVTLPEVEGAVVIFEGERSEGTTLELGPRKPGESLLVGWEVGTDCTPDAAWCMRGETELVVPSDAREAWSAELPVEALEPRQVVVPIGGPVEIATLGEAKGEVGETSVSFDVMPGKMLLALGHGSCPESVKGCGDACPPGCLSIRKEVVVGVGSEPLAIALTWPETQEPPQPTEPAPTPASTGGWVSASRFATFLGSHPEWEREAAIGNGKADAGYLRDWSDGTPPGAVTRVTWGAAVAYCSGRGGLLPLDAEPVSWPGGAVKQEWRSANGKPAWRRFDGVVSTQATANRAFPFTGFRCVR